MSIKKRAAELTLYARYRVFECKYLIYVSLSKCKDVLHTTNFHGEERGKGIWGDRVFSISVEFLDFNEGGLND